MTPDLELISVFKRNFTRVQFFQGSVMNTSALERVCVKESDAVLILANKNAQDQDAEDASNILRVIAIKNYYGRAKVIVQLLQYHNKVFLMNIPNWSWKRGDDSVCLSELKLGFIAQSCIAPGFSTLLANLFTMTSYDPMMVPIAHTIAHLVLLVRPSAPLSTTLFRPPASRSSQNLPPWKNEYARGASREIYGETLSPEFVHKSFTEAAMCVAGASVVEHHLLHLNICCRICYTKLKLVLFAIEQRHIKQNADGSMSTLGSIVVNPGDTVTIQERTQGFFIADSADEVKRYACGAASSSCLTHIYC